VGIAIAAFIALALIVPKASSGLHLLLFLLAMFALHKPRPALSAGETGFLVALFALWASGLLAFLLGGVTELGIKVLGRDLRLLFAIPVYLLLRRQAGLAHWVVPAFGVAGVLLGIHSGIESLLAESARYRASGASISIVFGHMAAAVAAVNFGLLQFAERRHALLLHVAGMAGACLAVYLSHTRGALLALLLAAAAVVIVTLFVRATREHFQRRFVVMAGFAMAAIVLLLAGSPRLVNLSDEISLSAFRPTGTLPAGCKWSEDALQQFARETTGSDDAAVKRARKPVDECGRYFLRFESVEAGRWSLPYRNVAPGTPLTVYTRGNGRMYSPERETVRIAGSRWRKIELPGNSGLDYRRYVVNVGAGKQLDIIPVRQAPAEWQYSAYASSFGTRLALWHFVTHHATVPSLAGSGLGSFPLEVREAAEAGQLPWFSIQYDHAHNDYLNVLFERGVIGLLSLLAVLFVPVFVFLRALLRQQPGSGIAATGLAAAGLGFGVSMGLSALSETMLIHSLSISCFALLCAALLAALHGLHSIATTDNTGSKKSNHGN
jgi:O-antigen ligase